MPHKKPALLREQWVKIHGGTIVKIIDWFDEATGESVFLSSSPAAKQYRRRINGLDQNDYQTEDVYLVALEDGRLRCIHKLEVLVNVTEK